MNSAQSLQIGGSGKAIRFGCHQSKAILERNKAAYEMC